MTWQRLFHELEVLEVKNIRFKSKDHEQFYYAMLEKSGNMDSYHQAFFYVMGIAEGTRANIEKMFDFKKDCIKPDGMRGGWQTSGSVRVCYLAFNLWNVYTEKGRESDSTPYDLFACGYAPYFYEGIKLRYPEYCKEIPVIKLQDTEYVR